VRRVADDDRRVKSLVVTADGRLLAEAMWRQVCEQAEVVLEMSDEESAGLALLLRRAGMRCTANGACQDDPSGPPPTRRRPDAAAARRGAGPARQ
jgi:hypothetical protein